MPAPSAPADPHERERRDLAHQALWIVRGLLVLVGTMPWWLPVVKGSLGPVGVILDALYIVICHRATPLPRHELHGAMLARSDDDRKPIATSPVTAGSRCRARRSPSPSAR